MTAAQTIRASATTTVRGAWHVIERNAFVYRRNWLIVLSAFFEPVFYLLSMWVGVGRLIGTIPGPDGQPIDYVDFVAPGLLASSAMMGAVGESTYRLFRKIVEGRSYRGMLATPIEVPQVALGEAGWAVVRGMLYSVGFLLFALPLGVINSWWALLSLPAAVLTCVMFAALGQAGTVHMRTWQDLDMTQLVMMPMFFCSTTFFPLSAYPRWAQYIVELTPLYNAVTLQRGLTTGVVGPALLINVAYMVVVAVVGLRWSSSRLGARIHS